VQIVRADGKDVRAQVTNASRALTRIAKDEGVPAHHAVAAHAG